MENVEISVRDNFADLFVGDTYDLLDNAVCICQKERPSLTSEANQLNEVQDESIVQYTFVDVRATIPESFSHAEITTLFERNLKRLHLYIPG